MVFLFGVDGPKVCLGGDAGDDIVDGDHGAEHAVVGVVVFVHAVAADQEEVGEPVGVVRYLLELVVGAEVGGVGLFHPEDRNIEDVLGAGKVHFLQFFYSGPLDGRLGLCPEGVGLVTEVFHADPSGIGVLDHAIAPVVVDHEAADLDVALLDIDPVVL